MSFRISSTPIGTFLDCKRKWYIRETEEDETKIDSEEIRFGSLAHAYMEAWGNNGFEIPEDWTQAAKDLPEGDYGSILPLFHDENLVEKVIKVCTKAVEDRHLQEFVEGKEFIGTEIDLTPLKVTANGIPIRGRIDLLMRCKETGTLCMIDYKTRGDLRYCPKKPDEFENNPQFALYGSTWHKKNPEEKGINVFHVNILRDSGRVAIYGTNYSPVYLEKMFRYFDSHLIPEMVETLNEERKEYVEPDYGACYKYGPCPYIDKCGSYMRPEDTNFLDSIFRTMNMQILSKQAPPEVEPVIVPEKPVSILDGANKRVVANLQKVGIMTFQDLRDYEGDLTEIPYLGEKTAERMLEHLEEYYADYTG